VPEALSAVHAGAPFADPLHVAALHDLIVLHYVRSYHYRRVHIDAFARARVGLVGQLVRKYPAQLGREALRETGLPSGADLLARLDRHRGLRSLSKQTIADWRALAHRISPQQWALPDPNPTTPARPA